MAQKRRTRKPPDRSIAARILRERQATALGNAWPAEGLQLLATAVNTDLPNQIRICGASEPLELLAEDPAAPAPADGKPKLKRFNMTAYTGAAMRLRGFPWPVVVDLAGMADPAQTGPIYRDHNPDRIVGHWTKAEKSAQRLRLSGVISGVRDDADEVRDLAANDFPWQASIGADVQRLEYVDRDEKVTVNGRAFTGPLYVARATTLGEASFVPRGADSSTSSSVAAVRPTREDTMFEQWLAARGYTQISDGERKVLRAAFDYDQAHPPVAVVNPPTPATPPIAANPPANPPTPTPLQQLEADIQARRQAEAAEILRINEIRRICAAQPDLTIEVDGVLDAQGKKPRANLMAHAIANNWTRDQTELTVLRASRPAGPFVYSTGAAPEASLVVLEAAALQAGNISQDILHHGRFKGDTSQKERYSDQVMQAAWTRYQGRIGLQQLMVEAARLNGYRGEVTLHGDAQIANVIHAMFYLGQRIEATGFTDGGISNLLANVQNKFLLMGYWAVNAAWRLIAAVRGVKDFKPTKEVALLGDYVYTQVGPDGELKHAVMGDQFFSNSANTYGRVHTLARQDIINDDLSALTTIPMRLGRGAMLKLNNVVWALFMNPGNADDNNPFWNSTGNPKTHGTAPSGQSAAGPNTFSGVGSALSSGSLQTALALFRNQVDPNGQPLAIDPRVLLVGPTNEIPAEQLLKAPNLVGTGVNSTNQPNYNAWSQKALVPAVSPYLENPNFTGFSATAWYLLADPSDMPVIQVCFLNGQEVPTVQVLIPPPGLLGIPMQGFFDLGAAMFNFRGGIKAVGA